MGVWGIQSVGEGREGHSWASGCVSSSMQGDRSQLVMNKSASLPWQKLGRVWGVKWAGLYSQASRPGNCSNMLAGSGQPKAKAINTRHSRPTVPWVALPSSSKQSTGPGSRFGLQSTGKPRLTLEGERGLAGRDEQMTLCL